jgi:hypothetical protein
MSLTSPTILDDLDIPKRTAHLAIMGKGGFHLFPFGVAYRAQEVQIRWIVTGAARGLGRAHARRLAGLGAKGRDS